MHSRISANKFLIHYNNIQPTDLAKFKHKLFLYDDLQRQSKCGLIVSFLQKKIQQFHPLIDQASLKTQTLLRLKHQLVATTPLHSISVPKIFSDFSFNKIRYWARLQEAEQIDFVLNQYSLFLHENNIHQVIFPTTKKLGSQSQFHHDLLVVRALIDNHQQLTHFQYQNARYFGLHRIKQISQTWQLLWRQKYLPKQNNFLINTQIVLDQDYVVVKTPIKQKLHNLRKLILNTYSNNDLLLDHTPKEQE